MTPTTADVDRADGDAATLHIADAVFAIRVDPRYALAAEDDPAYDAFLRPGAPPAASPGASIMPVRLGALDPARWRAQRPASAPSFDTGSAWHCHRTEDGNWFFVLPQQRADVEAPPLWCARVDDAPDGPVTLDVGPRLVLPSAGDDDPRPRLRPALRYPLDQLLMMRRLAARGGAIVHAAGLAWPTDDGDRFGIACLGVSGAGKSTLSRLLIEGGLPGDGVTMLSDDRLILAPAPSNGALRVHGTPWPGEGRIASHAAGHLGALFFLEQADEHRLVPLDAGAALARLLPVVCLPWFDAGATQAALDACGAWLARVPCYALRFRRDVGVAALLRDWRATAAGA
ncbi:MAG: hypothetical protein AAF772_00835 [Acidobacteriota bacterium]